MSFEKLLLAALLVIFAGCATSQAPSVRIRTSSGEKITVDMSRGGAVGPESKDLKITAAMFEINPKIKKGLYVFGIDFKTEAMPRSIKVEDVSDEKARTLVDESNLKIEKRAWRFACQPMGLEEKTLRWVHEIDESFRVYRFTVTYDDGRLVEQYHATFYPSFAKAYLLHQLSAETP